MGSQASKFLVGSDNNDIEFLRVYNTETKYHQLIANRGGIRLDTTDGNTSTTHWTAALKSESLVEKGTITTGDNLDNYINIGLYRFNGSPQNIPPGSNWGLLCVLRANNYTTQLAFVECRKMYTRALVTGNPWTSWLQS